MSRDAYLDAVGNRCRVSDDSPCVRCKAVHEACKYIRELETEIERLSKGRNNNFQAENKRLRFALGLWMEYIDADEITPPPIKETVFVLKGNPND